MNYKQFYKTDEDICNETGLSLWELKGAKQKLVDKGFIFVKRKGIPARTFYLLGVEEIILALTSCWKNQQLEEGITNSQLLEKPTTTTEITHEIKKDNIIIDSEEKRITGRNKGTTKLTSEQEKEFWDEYPRKEGKGAALKSLNVALSKTSFENILKGVKKYTLEKRDVEIKFIKLPKVWLDHECWNDEYEDKRREKVQELKEEKENEDFTKLIRPLQERQTLNLNSCSPENIIFVKQWNKILDLILAHKKVPARHFAEYLLKMEFKGIIKYFNGRCSVEFDYDGSSFMASQACERVGAIIISYFQSLGTIFNDIIITSQKEKSENQDQPF